MPLEIPKFITDLATGLQDIAAQLDAALAAIQEKRADFNNLLETKLKNYGFGFTTNLYDTFKRGVESGRLRVAGLLKELKGDKDNNGIINALDELSKLKIENKEITQVDLAVAADESDGVRKALNDVNMQINTFDTKDNAKSKRKSEITKAIKALEREMFKYVAIQKYGLNPDDVTDDMNVDALNARYAEKRTEAIVAAGLAPDRAAALDINTDSDEFKNAKITDLPGLVDAKFNSVIDKITADLNSDFRLGKHIKFLKKTSIADLPDGVVTRDLIEANKGKNLEDTIGKLVNNVYRPKIQAEADTYIDNQLERCADDCDPAARLPEDLKTGSLLVACSDRVAEYVTDKADDLKGRVWNDIENVTIDLESISAFSADLEKAEDSLAGAYNTFSAKVAALAAGDKKLSDKILGLVDTKMKNIDSEAAVTETLDEIKKVLQKSTGVDFGAPATP